MSPWGAILTQTTHPLNRHNFTDWKTHLLNHFLKPQTSEVEDEPRKSGLGLLATTVPYPPKQRGVGLKPNSLKTEANLRSIIILKIFGINFHIIFNCRLIY